ncbi:MAG: fibronectin type III domain-containing protein [Eubacterium sp.]|nr:fibronectin type III domain-containing protein [Eubacterium sp.]
MLTQTTGTLKNRIITKFIALALALTLCFAAPFSVKAAQVTKSIYTKTNYTHNDKFKESTLKNGIDISVHNGTIDFKKLSKTDTDIVIIRGGYRGYAASGPMREDTNFDYNIKNALANGFEVGVYFYSQAVTEAEARDEAEYILDIVKGYSFTLPIYFDYEFAEVSTGRLDSAWNSGKLNKSKMAKNAIAFCEVIEKAGYKAGVYSSTSFFQTKYDDSLFDKGYAMWLAHYNSKTSYAGDYEIWQYSAKGHVDGISGYVDSNYVYYDVLKPLLGKGFEVSKISKKSYTGAEIKPSFNVFYNGKKLIKGEDYYITFHDNINIGTASVTVTGVNDYTKYRQTKEFSIVPPVVTGLKVDSRDTNSLKISWDKNKYASKYYIQIYRNGSWKKVGTTKDTSYEIDDLSSAANYKIRVRGYKTIDGKYYYGYYSSVIESATSPAIPTQLKASSIRSTSLKLSWKKQTYASYYRVYKYNSSSKKYELYKESNTNSLKITDLSPNKNYKFKVRAYKKSADSKLLYSKRSDALSVYTSPAAPKTLSLKSPSANKINTSYSKVSGASGYQVRWSTTSDFSSNFLSVFVSKTSTVITTAQSNRTYYVRVRSYKVRDGKKYYSDWSATKSVKVK